jgi:hypothetical protein
MYLQSNDTVIQCIWNVIMSKKGCHYDEFENGEEGTEFPFF